MSKGLGVEGKIENLTVKIGNKTFLNYEKTLNNSGDELITEVFVAVNENIIASIELEDTIKKGVKDTLDKFKSNHKEIIMLTGDNSIIAKKIASKVGIERFYAEQLPADKLNFISDLQKQGKKVMMIGDGINDAPSLVQANIGVAISNASDISMEASDITIIKNDFEVLPKLFEISELSLKYLKINMWWAFSYNFVSIPLAMFGLLKPISAAAAMAISSLLIVSNSLRLRRKID
jgi:Cu+-exporting ATPase